MVTSRSRSSGTGAPGWTRCCPGRCRSDSGTVPGLANDTTTCAPRRSRARPRASALPSASASGLTWASSISGARIGQQGGRRPQVDRVDPAVEATRRRCRSGDTVTGAGVIRVRGRRFARVEGEQVVIVPSSSSRSSGSRGARYGSASPAYEAPAARSATSASDALAAAISSSIRREVSGTCVRS